MTGLEERLEPLFQLGCVWEDDSVTGSAAQFDASHNGTDISAEEEREWEVFTQVLWDGYVLCRWVFPRNINGMLTPPFHSIRKAHGTVDAEIDYMDQPIWPK